MHLFIAIGDRDGYRHADLATSPPEGVLGHASGLACGTSDDVDVARDDPNKLARVVRRISHVRYSDDGGATWSRVAAAGVTDAYAVGVGAPLTPGGYPSVFVAGTVDGRTGFFCADDEGQTWVRTSDDAHE